MAKRQFRVGILGAGGIGTTHAKRVVASGKATVDAVCSRTLASARKLSDVVTAGKAAAYDDFDRMLGEHELDALYVCVPPAAHAGEVERAAKVGVALMLEKPIALDPKRAASQVRAIERAGVLSHVGYHWRFAPAVRKLKRMIDDGSAGRVTLFNGTYLCNALHGAWWQDVNQSGGQVVEQVIHLYDMALHLCGPVKTVAGHVDTLLHDDVATYTVDDTSASLLRFKNGAIATIAGSNNAVPTDWRMEFTVVCENVTLTMRGPGDATLTHTRGKPSEHYWKTGEKPRVESMTEKTDLYQEQTDTFLAAIAGKTHDQALAPVREGLAGLKLVLGVRDSSKSV